MKTGQNNINKRRQSKCEGMNLNGGTVISGASISSMGVYVGTLLLDSGDIAIALCFLMLTSIYLLIIPLFICNLLQSAGSYSAYAATPPRRWPLPPEP